LFAINRRAPLPRPNHVGRELFAAIVQRVTAIVRRVTAVVDRRSNGIFVFYRRRRPENLSPLLIFVIIVVVPRCFSSGFVYFSSRFPRRTPSPLFTRGETRVFNRKYSLYSLSF